MVVVVLILVILAALVTTAGTGVINSSRATGTLTTMQVLELAIEQYAEEQPLTGEYYPGKYCSYPPDAYTAGPDQREEPNVPPGEDWSWDDPPIADYNGNGKFDAAYLNADIAGAIGVEGPAYDLATHSIETLYLYLTQLSPRAKTALEKLPSGQVTNRDRDRVVIDTDRSGDISDGDKRIDLFEVNDAWGRPLRYEVRPVWIGGCRWELRSAGPDGDYAAMWTPQDQSDDVIWPQVNE